MTIFIVLGFVILIVFMMLSIVTQGIRKANLQTEAKLTLHSFIESSTIQQYVTSCVDNVLDDGIEKISLQGGRIYDYQGGLINTSDYSEGTDFININMTNLQIPNNPYNETNLSVNVSYGLKSSLNNGSLPYLPGSIYRPPFYPAAYRTLNELNGFNNYLGLWNPSGTEGFYGEVIMSKLCENRIDCKWEDSAEDFNNFNTTTLQKQLEHYLEVQVKNCVNFDYFENLTPYTIKQGNITASVKFSVDEVSAKVDYPITMLWRDTDPITEIVTFNKNKNFRLAKIYRLAHSILQYDSFDMFFDPLNYRTIYGASIFFDCKMFDRTRCYDSQITVSKISNVCELCVGSGGYDDLIVIKDNASQVKGKSLVYQFVIQNRRPALDYIHNTLVSDIDIFVAENETINLRPEGYDPDNTLVWYNYSGWRENYYTWFNRTLWFIEPGEPFEDYIIYYNVTSEGPLNWSQSNEFIDSEQNASYTTQFGEIGIHNVTITIWDEAGLRDWQDVIINVLATPTAIANGSNNFSDIDNKFASVEDPYILNASQSYVIGETTDILNYIWKDLDEFGTISTQNPIQILPEVVYNIITIPPLNFSKTLFETNECFREANISLIVNDGWHPGQPDYLDLIVYECLPHDWGSEEDPYPYSDDMYQAPHVCCGNYTGGVILDTEFGKVESSGFQCFDITEYSSLFYFFNNQTDWYEGYLGEDNDLLDITGDHIDFDSSDEIANDIYTRDFTRNCDGTRGNICNGSATSYVTSTVPCDDETLFDTDYRCSGPATQYFDSATNNSIGGCVVYGNTNFEFLAGGATVTACRQEACYEIEVYNSSTVLVETVGSGPIQCAEAYCNGGQTPTLEGNCNYVYQDDCSCNYNICGADEACNNLDPGELIDPANLLNGCTNSCEPSDCATANPGYIFNINNHECFETCDFTNNFGCNQDENYRCDFIQISDDECVLCNSDHTQIGGSQGSGDCEEACDADNDCDEEPIGIISQSTGCDSLCHFIDCLPYAFNQINNQCYTSCNFNSHCATGFECSNHICVLEGMGS